MLRRAPALIPFLVTALLCLSACIGEGNRGLEEIFSSNVSLRDLDGVLMEPDSELDEWDYPDVDLGDGQVTRVIWFGAGESAAMFKIVSGLPSVLDKRVAVVNGIELPKQNRFDDAGNFKAAGDIKLEAISITGPVEDVDQVTEVIVGIQKSIPQIEIGIRVVEVLETDSFSFGIDSVFNSVESDPSKPTKSIFNSAQRACRWPCGSLRNSPASMIGGGPA